MCCNDVVGWWYVWVHGEQQWTEHAGLRNAGRAARWFGLFSDNWDVLLPVGDKGLQPAAGSTTDAKCSRTSINKDAVVYRVECDQATARRHNDVIDDLQQRDFS